MPVRAVLAALCLPVMLAAQAPSPSLAPLAFLKGTWVAEPDANGGTGEFTFAEALDGRVLVRKNRASIPARGPRPAGLHEDLMVVYGNGDLLKADYWDNEGHVIRYRVQAADPARVAMTSEGPGPRFRLTYQTLEKDRVEIRFEMAPADKPEAFTLYLAGKARRSR